MIMYKERNLQVVVDISSCDHLQREEFTTCGVYIVMGSSTKRGIYKLWWIYRHVIIYKGRNLQVVVYISFCNQQQFEEFLLE